MADETHGLAGEIRASIVSDQFDLSGYTEARVKDLVVAAFSTPLTAPKEMVRFTFLVGGGKLVRARYDEDLPKWVAAALRAIGYAEDRSAAETFDSQGTFKQQHDTGQNLKYVIIYPRVACSTSTSGKDEAVILVDPKSPQYIMCAADLEAFKTKFGQKISSWRQSKRLLKILQDNNEQVRAIEAKLCTGAPLTPLEQCVYDGNSGANEEKIAWLQGEIRKYVDEGRLTASEKLELQASLEASLKTVDEKIAEAIAADKPKKAEKLQEMKVEALARKAAAEKINPIQLRLRYGDEVVRLRLLLLPLIELEKKGRSMSLTMDDLTILRDKPDIEEDIVKLETASRGWFEEEEDFQARCAFEANTARIRFEGKNKKGANGKSGTGAASKGSGATWSTVAAGTGGKKVASSGPTKKTSEGIGFAAAFGASLNSD
ncbi:hypothetical protein CEUSTIGMA_g4788.t1 [Chlamydomonas eustigma]|uniref:Uncharacterized protein n=1 Tax=Chlamydomonas eustigma TaxID=1157962 RepID=A0A250X365_9CHLO|nr:hypothetical protein CEUSTIGMA_g4788.t1 [Chlamydomonas eustigma]|eukprot:GAX77342.1 hypothetical protein CEUSTIGMA_g4788.t1 [Chlamydomonas eustigma]